MKSKIIWAAIITAIICGVGFADTITQQPVVPSPLQPTDKVPIGRVNSNKAYTATVRQFDDYIQTSMSSTSKSVRSFVCRSNMCVYYSTSPDQFYAITGITNGVTMPVVPTDGKMHSFIVQNYAKGMASGIVQSRGTIPFVGDVVVDGVRTGSFTMPASPPQRVVFYSDGQIWHGFTEGAGDILGNAATKDVTGSGGNVISSKGVPPNGCLQILNGNAISTGANCGTSSGGSGTVNGGTAGQFGYYEADGNAIQGHTLTADDLPLGNATTKTAISDGDYFPIIDSSDSNTLKKTQWGAAIQAKFTSAVNLLGKQVVTSSTNINAVADRIYAISNPSTSVRTDIYLPSVPTDDKIHRIVVQNFYVNSSGTVLSTNHFSWIHGSNFTVGGVHYAEGSPPVNDPYGDKFVIPTSPLMRVTFISDGNAWNGFVETDIASASKTALGNSTTKTVLNTDSAVIVDGSDGSIKKSLWSSIWTDYIKPLADCLYHGLTITWDEITGKPDVALNGQLQVVNATSATAGIDGIYALVGYRPSLTLPSIPSDGKLHHIVIRNWAVDGSGNILKPASHAYVYGTAYIDGVATGGTFDMVPATAGETGKQIDLYSDGSAWSGLMSYNSTILGQFDYKYAADSRIKAAFGPYTTANAFSTFDTNGKVITPTAIAVLNTGGNTGTIYADANITSGNTVSGQRIRNNSGNMTAGKQTYYDADGYLISSTYDVGVGTGGSSSSGFTYTGYTLPSSPTVGDTRIVNFSIEEFSGNPIMRPNLDGTIEGWSLRDTAIVVDSSSWYNLIYCGFTGTTVPSPPENQEYAFLAKGKHRDGGFVRQGNVVFANWSTYYQRKTVNSPHVLFSGGKWHWFGQARPKTDANGKVIAHVTATGTQASLPFSNWSAHGPAFTPQSTGWTSNGTSKQVYAPEVHPKEGGGFIMFAASHGYATSLWNIGYATSTGDLGTFTDGGLLIGDENYSAEEPSYFKGGGKHFLLVHRILPGPEGIDLWVADRQTGPYSLSIKDAIPPGEWKYYLGSTSLSGDDMSVNGYLEGYFDANDGTDIVDGGMGHHSIGSMKVSLSPTIYRWDGFSWLKEGGAGTIGNGLSAGLLSTNDDKVGIGTTLPFAQFSVVKDWSGGNSTAHVITSLDSYGDQSRMTFRRANGTQASPSQTLAGDALGNLNFRGHTGTAWEPASSAGVIASAEENFTSGTGAARLMLYTQAAGSTPNGGSERMRIGSNGRVRIGTTDTTSSAALLGVAGDINITGNYLINGAPISSCSSNMIPYGGSCDSNLSYVTGTYPAASQLTAPTGVFTGAGSSGAGKVLLKSGSGSFYATIVPGSIASDITLTLPASSGTFALASQIPTVGTAAALDVGTTANKVVQFDASARYPANDGSQITNIMQAAIPGLTTSSAAHFGSVGAGVSPDYPVHTKKEFGSTSGANMSAVFTSYGDSARTIGIRGNGTIASPTAVVNGDALSSFGSKGIYDTSGGIPTGAGGAVTFSADENHSSTAQGTRVGIFTTTNGASSSTERLRITNDGRLRLIGQPSAPANNAACTAGDMILDAANAYLYLCVSANSWKRASFASY